jgi:hypothetical protein
MNRPNRQVAEEMLYKEIVGVVTKEVCVAMSVRAFERLAKALEKVLER